WLFDPQTAGGLLLAVPPEAGALLAQAFEAAGEPPIARIGRIGPPAPPGSLDPHAPAASTIALGDSPPGEASAEATPRR
ncbi:MAG: hypothetical protein K2X91_03730, partial [Thermoleophilia bacterium]|nr:hypothetical protein [Thermoleophilia bacterium]